jgi:HPt (histidine-containing phosphotransfer) domain-containing protein
MNLKECYDAFGGSYEVIRGRLPKDELIEKFVKKFLAEPSYAALSGAVEAGDYEEAFKAAHALKGVSANLSFTRLTKSVSELTELLRNSGEKTVDADECRKLFDTVTADYKEVTETIRKYEES